MGNHLLHKGSEREPTVALFLGKLVLDTIARHVLQKVPAAQHPVGHRPVID